MVNVSIVRWECGSLDQSQVPRPPQAIRSDQISRSVVSDSLRPHGLQPTRLLCPWQVRLKMRPAGGGNHGHLFFSARQLRPFRDSGSVLPDLMTFKEKAEIQSYAHTPQVLAKD